MNSDLSTEMADSALAVENNNNKRYPWAFVYMNIVAEAWAQNINNAGKGKQISCTQWFIQMACYQLCLSDDQRNIVFMNAFHFQRSSAGALNFNRSTKLHIGSSRSESTTYGLIVNVNVEMLMRKYARLITELILGEKKVKNVSYCTLRQLFKRNWINRKIKGHISNLIPALGKIFSTIINTCKKQKRQNRCEEYQSLHGSIAMLISCAFGGLPPCFCCRSNRAVKVGCCIFCLAAGRLFSASICYKKRNTALRSFFIKVGVPDLKVLR